MKKHYPLFLALLASSLPVLAGAQTTTDLAMNVNGTDGTVISSNDIVKISKLTFTGDETLHINFTNSSRENIDLNRVATITFGSKTIEADPSAIRVPQEVEFSVSAGSSINVTSPDGIKAVSVFSLGGQKLCGEAFAAQPTRASVSLSAVQNGICVVVVETPVAVVSQKVIIKK